MVSLKLNSLYPRLSFSSLLLSPAIRIGKFTRHGELGSGEQCRELTEWVWALGHVTLFSFTTGSEGATGQRIHHLQIRQLNRCAVVISVIVIA